MIYLYVKQHIHTGLKYFGKTKRKDPFRYIGSGVYWISHLKKHGKNIITLEVWGFDNQKDCTSFALNFSKSNNIVESDDWANLKFEDGLDGGYTTSREYQQTVIWDKDARHNHSKLLKDIYSKIDYKTAIQPYRWTEEKRRNQS